MRKLYLHIGLGKTGSSALQSWLSINAEELARQGIIYADLSADARAGKPSSGNGGPLIRAIRNDDFTEVERLLREVYVPPGTAPISIISSELLKDVRPPKLKKLQPLFERLNIETHIVAFVRSVYERAYSAYGQSVKNSGNIEAFSEVDVTRSMLTTLARLRKYRDHFGEAMMVLNYDDTEHDIFHAFAKITGIDSSSTQAIERRVNRSLSYGELEVQRQLNALHDGKFSAAIARHFIEADPDKVSVVHYDPELLKRTRDVCHESIEWINDSFHLIPPLNCDWYEERTPEVESENTGALLESVAKWALDYTTSAELEVEYLGFLASLAKLLGNESAGLREALLQRSAGAVR